MSIMTTMMILLCGGISQYGPGVMERVIENRQRWGQIPKALPEVHGYLAGREAQDIGRFVQMRIPGEDRWHTFLVVDVASKTDARWQDGLSGYEWMLKHEIAFEVDHAYVKRYHPEQIGRLMCMEWRWATEPVNGGYQWH